MVIIFLLKIKTKRYIPYSTLSNSPLFSPPVNLEESWSLKFLFNKRSNAKIIPSNLLRKRSSYFFVFLI